MMINTKSDCNVRHWMSNEFVKLDNFICCSYICWTIQSCTYRESLLGWVMFVCIFKTESLFAIMVYHMLHVSGSIDYISVTFYVTKKTWKESGQENEIKQICFHHQLSLHTLMKLQPSTIPPKVTELKQWFLEFDNKFA